MEPGDRILLVAVAQFFIVLALKLIYFRFWVRRALCLAGVDWRHEPGVWVEMKQIRALEKQAGKGQFEKVCRRAGMIFRLTALSFGLALAAFALLAVFER
jgi:hypothetical protein